MVRINRDRASGSIPVKSHHSGQCLRNSPWAVAKRVCFKRMVRFYRELPNPVPVNSHHTVQGEAYDPCKVSPLVARGTSSD